MTKNDIDEMKREPVRTRFYGIDALRILATVGIITIHLFSIGGLSGALNGVRTLRGAVVFPVHLLAFSSVNLYAMISGFVLIRSRIRFSKLLLLWLQVCFTGLFIFLAAAVLFKQELSTRQWISAVLPITTREYWYFSCYAALYCLLPIINRGLSAMNTRSLRMLLKLLFLLIVCAGAVGWLSDKDTFSNVMGYSVFWLLIMYLFGAGLRLTGFLENTPTWKLWLTVGVCVAVCFALAAVQDLTDFPARILRSGFFNPDRWRTLITDYQNPLLVVICIVLLRIFSRFNPGKKWTAVIKLLAPLTFGIYLIHVHDCIFSQFRNAFTWIAEKRALLILPVLLGVALVIFLLCAVLEWLRLRLFQLLRVADFCNGVEARLRASLFRSERK